MRSIVQDSSYQLGRRGCNSNTTRLILLPPTDQQRLPRHSRAIARKISTDIRRWIQPVHGRKRSEVPHETDESTTKIAGSGCHGSSHRAVKHDRSSRGFERETTDSRRSGLPSGTHRPLVEGVLQVTSIFLMPRASSSRPTQRTVGEDAF